MAVMCIALSLARACLPVLQLAAGAARARSKARSGVGPAHAQTSIPATPHGRCLHPHGGERCLLSLRADEFQHSSNHVRQCALPVHPNAAGHTHLCLVSVIGWVFPANAQLVRAIPARLSVCTVLRHLYRTHQQCYPMTPPHSASSASVQSYPSSQPTPRVIFFLDRLSRDFQPGFESYLRRDSSPRLPVWSARTHGEGVSVVGACQWMMNRRASAGG